MPVLISGGLSSAERAREAFERTGAAAVLLARGSLGNPWLFEQLVGHAHRCSPAREEILAELDWVIERACEHLGPERATRYLRKFYPWYVERLGRRPGAAGSSPAQRSTLASRPGSCCTLRAPRGSRARAESAVRRPSGGSRARSRRPHR